MEAGTVVQAVVAVTFVGWLVALCWFLVWMRRRQDRVVVGDDMWQLQDQPPVGPPAMPPYDDRRRTSPARNDGELPGDLR